MKNRQSTVSKYNTLLNEAISLQNQQYFREALAIYKKLLKKTPTDSKLLSLLGSVYGQINQIEKCIETLNRCLKLNPKQAEASNNLALAYEINQQVELAIKSYKHTLTIQPTNETALLNMATLLGQLGKTDEAETIYNQALEFHPNHPKLLSNYSALLQLNENFPLAESIVRKALTIAPEYPQALSNLGNILIKTEQFDEGEQCLLKAIALSPEFVEAHINLGFLYHNTARFDDALRCFNKAISLEPQSSTGHWYRSFTLLLTGKYHSAWDDYEYGIHNGERNVAQYPYPSYKPDTLNEASLLVNAEQGIGDQVMFSSCLSDLCRKTNNIVLECDKRLVPLFERSFPDISIIYTNQFDSKSLAAQFPKIKQKIAIGSLPRLFRRDKSAFTQRSHYLKINPEMKRHWQQRYQALNGKLNVGISWQGGIKVDHNKRSMPLRLWENILSCDCNFINLQYGDHRQEITEVENKFDITIHDWADSDSLQELDNFSAQIAALDLVISVGNTNVHLAGSLGVPAWCLIPQVPSWRWLSSGTQCLWYPSVKIYRQKKLHQWKTVLDTVKTDLEKLITLNANEHAIR